MKDTTNATELWLELEERRSRWAELLMLSTDALVISTLQKMISELETHIEELRTSVMKREQ